MKPKTLCLLFCLLLCLPVSACTPEKQHPNGSESVSDQQESLPQSDSAVLLYDYYIKAQATQNGISYEYTYCIDRKGKVFNAIACVCFATPEDARNAYKRFCKDGYLNLKLDDQTLSYAFPRRQCPYFGISCKALPKLLEGTIYTVTEQCLPDLDASSEPSK